MQRRDELLEPDVVFGQPCSFRLEQRSQPRELLIRGKETLAHNRGRWHREIDRPEQGRVQLGLVLRQLVGRRGGKPDDMHVAELLNRGADDVAPE